MSPQIRDAYRFEGVDCAVCAADIERALRRELGREDIEVRFLSNEIVVPADAARPESDIAAIVSRIEPGARIRPLDGDGRQTAPDDADRRAARLRLAE